MNAETPDSRRAEGLDAQLAQIERLLNTDPAAAESRAAELLATVPDHPTALLFQGMARRLIGQVAAAVEVLAPLCERLPGSPFLHLQLGLAQREAGDAAAAEAAMRQAIRLKTDFAEAWLALAHLLTAAGDEGADEAYAGYIPHALQNPRLYRAKCALDEGRERDAEGPLRQQLAGHPRDVVALRLLAQVALRARRPDEATELLERCLDLAPGYREAREDYAMLLARRARPVEALHELDRLLEQAPDDPALLTRKAATLIGVLEYEAAAAIYADLAERYPGDAGLHASLGHCLRILGRQEASVAAYRHAVAAAPHSGEAWWNLANLKTQPLSDDDLAAMQAELVRPGLGDEDRLRFHFALGKALEDRGRFAESFEHYAEGNRLRRQHSAPWNPDRLTEYVERCRALFTPEFFAAREGAGSDAIDPVFVIGLPRSGSTLVEQILASHSEVEGTTELRHLPLLAEELIARHAGTRWPDLLAEVELAEFRRLGEEYLERTRPWRKLRRTRFIDKLPNNFEHVALIHLALPRARIIDVRRHPMACGLSLFRHLFARGQSFSYDLEHIGRYYADYARLMAHFDAVLPGRVHRVRYERLVENTETEIRALLEHCGLPFEAACLEFHRSSRAVATASSEQVRRGIFREGLDRWRAFEPWLEPLRRALGDAGPGALPS